MTRELRELVVIFATAIGLNSSPALAESQVPRQLPVEKSESATFNSLKGDVASLVRRYESVGITEYISSLSSGKTVAHNFMYPYAGSWCVRPERSYGVDGKYLNNNRTDTTADLSQILKGQPEASRKLLATHGMAVIGAMSEECTYDVHRNYRSGMTNDLMNKFIVLLESGGDPNQAILSTTNPDLVSRNLRWSSTGTDIFALSNKTTLHSISKEAAEHYLKHAKDVSVNPSISLRALNKVDNPERFAEKFGQGVLLSALQVDLADINNNLGPDSKLSSGELGKKVQAMLGQGLFSDLQKKFPIKTDEHIKLMNIIIEEMPPRLAIEALSFMKGAGINMGSKDPVTGRNLAGIYAADHYGVSAVDDRRNEVEFFRKMERLGISLDIKDDTGLTARDSFRIRYNQEFRSEQENMKRWLHEARQQEEAAQKAQKEIRQKIYATPTIPL